MSRYPARTSVRPRVPGLSLSPTPGSHLFPCRSPFPKTKPAPGSQEIPGSRLRHWLLPPRRHPFMGGRDPSLYLHQFCLQLRTIVQRRSLIHMSFGAFWHTPVCARWRMPCAYTRLVPARFSELRTALVRGRCGSNMGQNVVGERRRTGHRRDEGPGGPGGPGFGRRFDRSTRPVPNISGSTKG